MGVTTAATGLFMADIPSMFLGQLLSLQWIEIPLFQLLPDLYISGKSLGYQVVTP